MFTFPQKKHHCWRDINWTSTFWERNQQTRLFVVAIPASCRYDGFCDFGNFYCPLIPSVNYCCGSDALHQRLAPALLGRDRALPDLYVGLHQPVQHISHPALRHVCRHVLHGAWSNRCFCTLSKVTVQLVIWRKGFEIYSIETYWLQECALLNNPCFRDGLVVIWLIVSILHTFATVSVFAVSDHNDPGAKLKRALCQAPPMVSRDEMHSRSQLLSSVIGFAQATC